MHIIAWHKFGAQWIIETKIGTALSHFKGRDLENPALSTSC